MGCRSSGGWFRAGSAPGRGEGRRTAAAATRCAAWSCRRGGRAADGRPHPPASGPRPGPGCCHRPPPGAVTVGAHVAAGLLQGGWLVGGDRLGQGRGQEHRGVLSPGIGIDPPASQPVQQPADAAGLRHGRRGLPPDPGVVGPDGGAEQMQGGAGRAACGPWPLGVLSSGAGWPPTFLDTGRRTCLQRLEVDRLGDGIHSRVVRMYPVSAVVFRPHPVWIWGSANTRSRSTTAS
jgi:hypothetical protein